MNEGVYTFPKGINPKVNVIVQLEFKFIYYLPKNAFLFIIPQDILALI